MGGCGERAFLSLRIEREDGDLEGGKEEKEGCRCRLTTDCEAAGPLGRWAITSAMSVSIFLDRRAYISIMHLRDPALGAPPGVII